MKSNPTAAESKKVVLITGASRGIGRALCSEALTRGYEVHGLVRNADQVPQGVVPHVADLRDRPAIAALMKELAPRLDLYLANAGVGHDLNPKLPDIAEKAAEVMEINGTATVYSIYALAYEWIQLGARGKRIFPNAPFSSRPKKRLRRSFGEWNEATIGSFSLPLPHRWLGSPTTCPTS